MKTRQVLPRAAMRAGKRAARREVLKHIDFPEGIKQKITPPKDRVNQISERFFRRRFRFKIVLEGLSRFEKGLGDKKQ